MNTELPLFNPDTHKRLDVAVDAAKDIFIAVCEVVDEHSS
jgi:hypothetical protein